jgi:ParB/Sulfiredoxin domain
MKEQMKNINTIRDEEPVHTEQKLPCHAPEQRRQPPPDELPPSSRRSPVVDSLKELLHRLLAPPQYSAWSQTDFIRAVRDFSDQFPTGHPGRALPEEFTWRFAPRFRLSRLPGEAKKWVRWSAQEKAAWIDEYGKHPKQEFETTWLPQPSHYPIIVVKGTDGSFYLWDGNHRVGVAYTAGRKTVPAIVGFRKAQRPQSHQRQRASVVGTG